MTNICEEEITFVIQGQVITNGNGSSTFDLIRAIKSNFPSSPIILSTWNGQDTSALAKSAEIVISEDPGGKIGWIESKTINNVNRQIVSSSAGLQKVATTYAVKLRSDMLIQDNSILYLLNNRPKRKNNSNFDILEELVISGNVTAYNPRFKVKRIHHPCDWIFAGLTADLQKIWDIPLMPQEWFNWFSLRPNNDLYFKDSDQDCRYDPEEYIWITFLRKYKEIDFKNSFDITKDNLATSEGYIVRNLQIFPISSMGLFSLIHPHANRVSPFSYSPLDWALLARQYGLEVKLNLDLYSIKTILLRLRIVYQSALRKLHH